MEDVIMTKEEAVRFLCGLKLQVAERFASNYDCDRYLKVCCTEENPWGPNQPGGPEDTLKKFEAAVKAIKESL